MSDLNNRLLSIHLMSTALNESIQEFSSTYENEIVSLKAELKSEQAITDTLNERNQELLKEVSILKMYLKASEEGNAKLLETVKKLKEENEANSQREILYLTSSDLNPKVTTGFNINKLTSDHFTCSRIDWMNASIVLFQIKPDVTAVLKNRYGDTGLIMTPELARIINNADTTLDYKKS